jgi:hypothetical protein
MAKWDIFAERIRDLVPTLALFDERNLLRDAFPAAVGFTDASWNPAEPAEVDATSASLSDSEMRSPPSASGVAV